MTDEENTIVRQLPTDRPSSGPRPIGPSTRETFLHIHDRLVQILKGEYCGEPLELSFYDFSVITEAKRVLGHLAAYSLKQENPFFFEEDYHGAVVSIPRHKQPKTENPSPKEATND